MTISITVSQCSFEGDGSSVTFPIADGSNGIYFTSSDEIAVTVDGATVSPSAYAVSGAGTDSGSITFTSAPADGTAGIIKRNTVITQGLSLTRGGYLSPTSVMESIDKLTRIDQDQQRQIDDIDTRVVDAATAAAGAAAAAVSATNAATSAAAAATSATSAATSATAAVASATSAASNLAVLQAIVENPGFDLAPGSYPLDDISAGFNGSATTFNLTFLGVAKTPASAGQLLVHLGSGHQIPTSAYTVSGSSITFADPPAAGLSCALLLIQIDTSDLAAAEAAAVAAATAAATSATGAATSASNAATSATAAAGSASNAATSASNAASSASSAATSESNAAASATAAQGYATAAAGYSESMAWGYAFDSATTDADPGSAKFRFNNATFSAATYLYISKTAVEGDLAALMAVWDDSTSTIKAEVEVRDPLAATHWWDFYISGAAVDATSYVKFPITPVAASGTITNGTPLRLAVTRNGDAGTGAVSSFNGRTGTVLPANDDYAITQMAAIAANALIGNNTGSSARPIVLTVAQVKTLLALAAGDISGLAASATTDATNASNIAAGTLAAARGGAGTVTGLLKADGAGAVSAAGAGSDYLAPPSGTALQKANSGGALANAAAGTDYVAPGGALGTPSSGTLTNCTGLPTAGVSGLGSAATQNTGTSGASVPLLNGANVWSGQQSVSLATLTDAANIAWDVAAKQKASVTLGGNRTMDAVSNAVAGTTYLLWVIQDGTGSRTLSWTTSGAGAFDFGADGAPTLTTTASKADLMVFEAISIGGTLKLRYAGIKKGFA